MLAASYSLEKNYIKHRRSLKLKKKKKKFLLNLELSNLICWIRYNKSIKNKVNILALSTQKLTYVLTLTTVSLEHYIVINKIQDFRIPLKLVSIFPS